MNITVSGDKMTWGVKPEWATDRIINIPFGAKVIRRRFRPKQVGVAFVQHGQEMRKHYLGICDGGLKLLAMVGLNRKESNG